MYAIPHLKENEVIDYIPQERSEKRDRFYFQSSDRLDT